MKTFWTMFGISLVCLPGCEDQVKKSPNAIFHKTTQDVGKFDPNAKQEVSDSKVRVTNDPITAPLQAYGPMMEQTAKLGVDHALGLFNATEGRYPKDYDEFMSEIIKKNNIKLPVLPYGDKYQYDEVNHTLVVIKGQMPRVEGAKEGATDPAAAKKE